MPAYAHLFDIHSSPVTIDLPSEQERCMHTFPNCPDIRCQKKIHSHKVICRAVNVHPYYAIFWEAVDER
jgi:hypothetical protein